MNKFLGKLVETYESLDANSITKTTMLSMLCKNRNKGYNNAILSNSKENIQEDSFVEAKAFSSLLGDIALVPNQSAKFFEEVMQVFMNMNKCSVDLCEIEDDLKLDLLDYEVESIKVVLKKLKEHPHKAGIKIKSAKRAICSLNEDREEIIERWRAEMENQDSSDNPDL